MKNLLYWKFNFGHVLRARHASVFDFRAIALSCRLSVQNRSGVIHFAFKEINVVSQCFMRGFRMVFAGYRLFRLLPNSLMELSGEPALSEIFGFQKIVAIRDDHEWLRRQGNE